MMTQRAWPLSGDPAGVGTAMIASGAVPALLPAHIGVSQTSRFTTQSGLCRHPGRRPSRTLHPRLSVHPFGPEHRNLVIELEAADAVGGVPVATVGTIVGAV